MQVMRLASPDAFAARCEDFLSAREDMNTLILGVLCSSGGWRESAPLCVTVEEGGRLAMAGLRTPPFNLILSHGERGAAKVMAEALAQESEGLSGVIAMEDLAEAFAEAWKSAGMAAPGQRTELILHGLRKVETRPAIAGELRLARPEESDWLGAWNERASSEMGLSAHEVANARQAAAKRIDKGQVYLWCREGEPVSLAAYQPTSLTGTSGRINMVYTPPEWRGRGYATACVAALTAERLASGWSSCLIFTDKQNAVTNKIYRRIGYQVLARFLNIDFGAA